MFGKGYLNVAVGVYQNVLIKSEIITVPNFMLPVKDIYQTIFNVTIDQKNAKQLKIISIDEINV